MAQPPPYDAVTLQVNTAPSDAPHAQRTLRHQLRQWGGQVAEVVYTFDGRRSAGPRGRDFDLNLPQMEAVLSELAAESTRVRVVPVDYGPQARRTVAEMFFAGVQAPDKDCFGAPFYGYFQGLSTVRTRYVLHMDCDMLYGGGSQSWLAEAVSVLDSRPDALFVNPLAGPPTADGSIPAAVVKAQLRAQLFGSAPVLEARRPLTYRLRHVSSRVFCADLDRLRASGALTVLGAPWWTYGSDLASTPYLPAETVLSRHLQRIGAHRLDRLGDGTGMWFLHPGQRGPAFLANLDNTIDDIERGRIPDRQRGHFELLDETLDAAGPLRLARARGPLTPRAAARRLLEVTGVLAWRRRRRAERWLRELPG